MSYAVYLKVETQTYQRFIALQQQLNSGAKQKLAHDLGDILADVSIQIVQQVFIDLLEQQKTRLTKPESHKVAEDSEKVIAHVLTTLRKYLPWSIALLSNERLQPLVNYFTTMIRQEGESIYVRYDVDDALINKTLQVIGHVREGNKPAIADAFVCLNEIIDVGVTQLIREPKDILKFNFVVNKTLNGVIQVATNMAYKRLASLGQEVELASAPYYLDHFLKFLHSK
ncbi:hypothetical protein I2F27_08620 [Acinetobacter sp. B5B]|uniref:hypothetical protein n=1 Tax=Acinetobacter baretiae TaxID=2605383 RepID=UPI0018C1D9F0|nr:hypothetical protein [Acinetobacter baretiae]MBF7683387.1 hypothetical protein [Acinetobacter baretiae]